MPKNSRKNRSATVKIIGVGGGGCNAVSRMKVSKAEGVILACINTDAQALALTNVPTTLCIGNKTTRGLGSGGDPNAGWKAAEESHDEILELVEGADMVFVAAGMGGGTGTGAAPVVARLARQSGALTVGVVTKPFSFEGRHRMKVAEEGLSLLIEQVDTLVTINNNRLLDLCDYDVPIAEAFAMVDDILGQGVLAISDVINVPGEINVDFADACNVMLGGGKALMAMGMGEGEDRMIQAINSVLASPLLEDSIHGATGVLFNITGGHDLTLGETNQAAELINKAAHRDALVIFGVVQSPEFKDQVRITLIATGMDSNEEIDASQSGKMIRSRGRMLADGSSDISTGDRDSRTSVGGFKFGNPFKKRSSPRSIRR